MEMDHRDSDLEGSVCSPDYVAGRRLYDNSARSGAEVSEPEEEGDEMMQPRLPSHPHPQPPSPPNTASSSDHDMVSKIKRERDDREREEHNPGSGAGGGSQRVSPMGPMPHAPFQIPIPFPFHPPTGLSPAAFLQPGPSYPPPQNPVTQSNIQSSGSSHSSESSSSSQQQTWSFEEQFKQVRQLYEISDDPRRKEFLDDLFSFMQRRGTPINRLPIMAKSVLDLFELYNLVIQRGGLVDVINKKLWQEIIKGLHLPSSITSAAFTLRTQYMKYLYPYECEKRALSTPADLQQAIDGNRREGRRGSYGYGDMMQRSPTQMSPLSLVTSVGRPQLNGNGHHTGNHLPPHQMMPPSMSGPMAGVVPHEFEARLAEYVKTLNRDMLMRNTASTPPNHHRSPPGSPHEPGFTDMSRLTLWNLYHSQQSPPAVAATSSTPPTPPAPVIEPQNEPINLEKREASSAPPLSAPPAKRVLHENKEHKGLTHIKISSKGEGRAAVESSLVVTIDINGIEYQGVLFAQTPQATNSNNSNNNSSNSARHQS